MGALLGDEVVEAGPGDLVFKPRNEWHTFWNAGEEPCRILEIIAPAGFEHFFEELVDMGGALEGRPGGAGGAHRPLRAGDETGDASPSCWSASTWGSASRWRAPLLARLGPQRARCVGDGPRSRRALLPSAGRQSSACASVFLMPTSSEEHAL